MQTPNKMDTGVAIPMRRYFPVLLILIIGITVSITLSIIVKKWEKTNQRHEFDLLATAYINDVETTFKNYAGELIFFGDFFNNSTLPVTRQQFSNIVKSIMHRYPGIQTFG